MNMLKQKTLLSSPPQQPCPVSRVITVKETTVEPSVEDEIPLDVRVCMEERTEVKIESERRAFKFQRAGSGPETPGQQRLSSWKMQRATVDGCFLVDGSPDLGEPLPFKPSLME